MKKILQNIIKNHFNILSFWIILTFSIVLYGNSLTNEFITWDDESLIVNNNLIHSLDFDNIKKIFTFHKYSTYQPVRVLSYAIDYHFWELSPVGYHIHSILLHFLAAFFVYLILFKILNRISDYNFSKQQQRYISLLTAILFLSHPISVESVTCLSCRKYPLMAFWGFLSFYFFISSIENNKHYWIYTILSLISLSVSILSSPFGAIFPPLFFLFDYCQNKNKNPFFILKKHFLFYIPYLLTCAFIIFPIINNLIGGSQGGADVGHYQGKPIYTFYMMLKVFFDYMVNIVFPVNLSARYIDYVYKSFWHFKVYWSAFTLITIVLFLFSEIKKGKKFSFFCIGWFFLAWLPVSNIIPISTKMADRYIYVANIGAFLLFSVYITKIYNYYINNIIAKNIIIAIVGMVLISLSFLTIERNKVWENSITLWQDSIEKDELNYVAHYNLALALSRNKEISKAIHHYQKAIEVDPEYFEAYNNLANLFAQNNQRIKAIKIYRELIKIRSNYTKALISLAATLLLDRQLDETIKYCSEVLNSNQHLSSSQLLQINYILATALYDKGQSDRALIYYNQALNIDSKHVQSNIKVGDILYESGHKDQAIKYYDNILIDHSDNIKVHYKVAKIFMELGQVNKAIKKYNQILKAVPHSVEAFYNLGILFYNQNRLNDSIKYFQKALDINSKFAEAYNGLGMVLAKIADFEQSNLYFQKAIDINLKYIDAYFNYGNSLLIQQKTEQALKQYYKILEINPDYADVYNNIGTVFARKGDFKKAYENYKQAVTINPDFRAARNNMEMAFKLIQAEQK